MVALAILAHALFPRYEWRDPGGDAQVDYVRIDRWTGTAMFGQFADVPPHPPGTWVPADEIKRARSPQ